MSEEKTLKEKIYFEDENAKITNVRVTCRHLTVPVGKVGSVDVNYKAETFSLSVICLILSATPFLFISLITSEEARTAVSVLSLILIVCSLLLLFMVFKSYAELVVSVEGRGVKLLSVSMTNKSYVEMLCTKIGDAILDEKKYRELKASGNLDSSLRLDPSETLRLKMILDDYEEIKELKEKFLNKKENK